MDYFYRVQEIFPYEVYVEGFFKDSEEADAIDHANHLLTLHDANKVKVVVERVYFGIGDKYETVYECGSEDIFRR